MNHGFDSKRKQTKTMVNPNQSTCSQAEKAGAFLFVIALFLIFCAPAYAPVPLIVFILLCCIAPFCPQWSFFLPIVSRGTTDCRAVALTFDDGPSPVSTPILLRLLKQYGYKATFFVIGKKAEKHPGLIADILSHGHTIGNHSWQHDSLLMLRNTNRLRNDIRKTQDILKIHGIRPSVFRPPLGISNPRLKTVLTNEKLLAVNFNCRAFDHGNKKIIALAERITETLHPGDIILLHDLAPETPEAIKKWGKEIDNLFLTLQKNRQEVAALDVLIGSQVMSAVDTTQTNPKRPSTMMDS